MSCKKIETCANCGGSGKQIIDNPSYPRYGGYPHGTVLDCYNCNGKGKTTQENHDYVSIGWSSCSEWFKCRKCGKKDEMYYGN